ncbi:peptidylprolyl isomerase [Candidatus Woesearchaeota archaeon]|nr:peptidylprolyl isomerase [Candidatus Woesearchaeota archaeon]
MMEQIIKDKDFVELNFTGRVAETGEVFDTTLKEIAMQSGNFNEKFAYKPYKICVGRAQILPAIDQKLNGLEVGKEKVFNVPCEQAFGKKEAKMVQLVATSKFKKQGVNPQPGMRINVDNMIGTIKTVSGGRTLVDFNHPLAGKELEYTIKVDKIMDDKKEMIEALFDMFHLHDAKIEEKDNRFDIKIKADLNDEIIEQIKKEINDTITKKEISIEKDQDKV